MDFRTNETVYDRFTGEAFAIVSCNGCVAELSDGSARLVGELTRVGGFNPEDHYARTNAPHNPEAEDLIGPGAVNRAEQIANIRDEEIG